MTKNRNFIVVDIETTGLSKHRHAITEIAAVKLRDGEIINQYQSLVNPECHIPSFITRLTGIDDDMVKDAPNIQEVLNNFLNFLGEDTIVAHNATFDYGFLDHNSYLHLHKRLCNDKICTRKLANRILHDLPSKKLSHLCDFFSVENPHAHRAMSDALSTTKIFVEFLNILEKHEIIKYEQLLSFQNMTKKLG